MKKIIQVLSVLFVALTVHACASKPGVLEVTDVWARPTPAGQTAAVYFIVNNDTSTDDQLVGASSDLSTSAEIHMTMIDGNDMVTMTHGSVSIPADETINFEPAGFHIMLVNLNRELKTGDIFTITFSFEKAGDITVQGIVQEQ